MGIKRYLIQLRTASNTPRHVVDAWDLTELERATRELGLYDILAVEEWTDEQKKEYLNNG